VLASAVQLGGCAAPFVPFSDVEELKPQRLHDFCEAGSGASGELRRCGHTFRRRLDDGGDVHLRWSMLVDPDSILSLDTEAEHGVRLASCSPSGGGASGAAGHELRLELPDTHAHHAAEGKFIVGSRFAHDCAHVGDASLYHRVVGVRHRERRLQSGQHRTHVHLATESVPSLAHVVPKLDFHFEWMPAEARDVRSFPEMRTDWGQFKDRRLMSTNPFSIMKKALTTAQNTDGVDADSGGFQSGSTSHSDFDLGDTMLNLHPKQMSNMGWNWDYNLNTTEEPEINIDEPGAKGRIRIYKPYVKMHTGIFFNHSSEMADLTKIPKVSWMAGLDGHGEMSGRLWAYLNTTSTAGVDPFGGLNFPIIKELATPKWYDKINFATGNLPMSVQPGVQFNGKMYHSGEFKGTVACGMRSHVVFKPAMAFNSEKGLQMTCDGCELQDADIWPPMWIIFTKQFELGLMGMPQMLMKGDFGGLEKATLGFEMRPYVNITVTRDGNATEGSASTKKLIAYPFRVMGLAASGFGKSYVVKVNASGNTVSTSKGINWGTVTYRDYVSKFDLGNLPEKDVLNQDMTVSLYEVDGSTETLLGSGVYTCTSLMRSQCHPSPAIVTITSSDNSEVAAVELAVVWDESPDPWFASHIRGVALSFPSVQLKDPLAGQVQSSSGNGTAGLTLLFVHGGRTYASNVSEKLGQLAGNTAIVFAPTFVSVWKPCSETSAAASKKCESPSVQLLYDGQVVAEAALPSVDPTSETAMQGTKRSSDYDGGTGLDVPLTVALTAPGKPSSAPLAVVGLSAHITSIMASGQFLKPMRASQVALGASELLVWTVPDVDTSMDYRFVMQVLRMTSTAPPGGLAARKVGSSYLEPAGSPTSLTSRCQATAMKGMSTAQAPCSFSHLFPFSEKNFAVGDTVVLIVTWAQDDSTYAMRSLPFQVMEAGFDGSISGRRLAEVEATGHLADIDHLAGVPVRRLQEDASKNGSSGNSSSGLSPQLTKFKNAWNQQVADHSTGCNERNLNFKMGGGFLVRGNVQSVQVPKGFPMMGGLNEAPALSTGWRSLAKKQNGSSMQDLFGGKMCEAGLCAGALPGCTNATFKKVHVPTINFGFNRVLNFSADPGKQKMLKNALAYAFSMMPEVVDVVLKDLEKTSFFKSGSEDDDEPAPATQPVLGASSGTVASAPPVQQQPAPAPSAPTKTPEENLDRFWPTSKNSRRLGEAARSHVAVRFLEEAPYEISPELVGMMVTNGYFQEVEDLEDDYHREKGPIRITDFWFDDGVEDMLPIEQGYSLRSAATLHRDSALRPQAATRLAAIPVAAACLVAAVMALAALRRSPRDFEAEEAEKAELAGALE